MEWGELGKLQVGSKVVKIDYYGKPIEELERTVEDIRVVWAYGDRPMDVFLKLSLYPLEAQRGDSPWWPYYRVQPMELT